MLIYMNRQITVEIPVGNVIILIDFIIHKFEILAIGHSECGNCLSHMSLYCIVSYLVALQCSAYRSRMCSVKSTDTRELSLKSQQKYS